MDRSGFHENGTSYTGFAAIQVEEEGKIAQKMKGSSWPHSAQVAVVIMVATALEQTLSNST